LPSTTKLLAHGIDLTARVLVQVFEFVKLAELYYAGSHGMDIKGPANKASSRHAKANKVG
jgi:trehalose 6-phosphate phosphatase